MKEAGLNPYLLEFVAQGASLLGAHGRPRTGNPEGQGPHQDGAAKAALLEEGEEIKLPVGKSCLIIGGGVSGMNAAWPWPIRASAR